MSVLRKWIVVILVGLICNSAMASVSGAGPTKPSNITVDASRVKRTVETIGIGTKAKVTVRLLDDKKFKGYISSIDNDVFTVTDSKGLETKIRYDQVKFISRRGLGIGSWILVGALVTVAAVVVGGYIAARCQYGC